MLVVVIFFKMCCSIGLLLILSSGFGRVFVSVFI